jgi:hypothetical protein
VLTLPGAPGASGAPAAARPLLERFAADLGAAMPLLALWAHGSLALGDYQPGRSDLDLIAVLTAEVSAAQRAVLQRVHAALARDEALADKLHCSYVAQADLAEVARPAVTWAHGELMTRPVSPVTRRELLQGGLCLHGPAPAGLVPPVTDAELTDFIRGDLRDFWLPATGRPHLWLRDIWVDLGLLTLARASVTLQEGRLITKREALEVLAGLDAPADVVHDIYQRRYETPPPGASVPRTWRIRRAQLARAFVRAGIERVLQAPQGLV